MCSTVQEQITTCGQNAIVKIGERTNIRPQKQRVINQQVLAFPKSWRSISLNTVRYLHTACFVL